MTDKQPILLVRQIEELRNQVAAWKSEGLRVSLVPTMGALHDGHASLVKLALKDADRVVVSLFVNPKQFNDRTDLANYPRTEDADRDRLEDLGAHMLYAPVREEIYPEGFATSVVVEGPAIPLEGAHRPGHFAGVATVVCKLFNQVQPHSAVFGEKDFQQLAVLRRMVRDLDMAVEIIGGKTIREKDGLALSSRNERLSDDDRKKAAGLSQAMTNAVDAIEGGADIAGTLNRTQASILEAGFEKIDYLALVGAEDLQPMDERDRDGRLVAAAFLGGVRLIDNMPVKGPRR
ncbi:pantoate--beta-alanine ligase [Notoacmeibacter sp. MSK16QG-6]|uniref:pantoate--beta-alanine ligase n=1 Tax=Notoacmeibacter sp. MSK16QG-6 TaxID=2957982 RepID=UPI00209F788A|nr:pantoate--beta-alanine ligase [Notoacmeibacter sp. MSK16QG-6]MCP1198874.1 pantoate--beta-alanine ligase [Notoacmeibacter sp. MSK16QG-6]